MPLFSLSLGFLSGVILGAALGWPLRGWAAGILLTLAVVFLIRRLGISRFSGWRSITRRLGVPLPAVLLALLAGGLRYQAAQPRLTPAFIAWYNDTRLEMAVVGVVAAPPDRRDAYTNLRVGAERVRPAHGVLHNAVRGLLLVRLPPGGDWRYGDRLILQGELETPPADETFSYRDYLARQGVYSYMPRGQAARLEAGQGNPVMAGIASLKTRALEVLYRLFADPEASLLAGILLGVETGIPRPVQEAFQDTGTSHIIAISGFNITLLASLFVAVFGRLLGPRRGALVAAVGIGFYTVLVGADAAVVRAALMGGLALLARQVGRRQAALTSLAFTAALMALFNPRIPWDVGFQLSFAATLGLVLYADPLSEGFIRLAEQVLPTTTAHRLAGPVGEYALFTLAAQVTTLPVTAYHFQRLSWTALLANPAILPVQPAVMIAGGLALLLGMIFLPLGRLAAGLAWPFAAYTIRAVELFARLPSGVLVLGELSLAGVAGLYALLLAGTLALNPAWPRLRAIVGGLAPSVPLSALAALTVFVWRAALSGPDGRLHLVVLDVSAASVNGDALLIRSPTGRFMLVNGGPRASLLSDGLGRRLAVEAGGLDYLMVASPYEGQVDAPAEVLARYPPGEVLWAGPPGVSRGARRLREFLAAGGIPLREAEAGHTLALGGGARLEVVAAGTRGAVLLLAYGRFRALLPVGLDFETLERLVMEEKLQAVTVLLLAEGGYAPLNPPGWIDHLHPQLALLSVAADDREGLPSRETLQALEGYTVLRTDRHGWIELITDGEKMWVAVERR